MAASRPAEQATANFFAFGTAQGRVLEGAHKIEKNIISEFSKSCRGQEYLPPGSKPASGNKYIIDGLGWLGREVDEQVQQAVAAIKEILKNTPKDKLPLRVNLMGYSRGAVTCLRIANAVYEDASLRDLVEFNILAIDPVAGSGNKADWHACNIPPNVKNYVAPIHLDEPGPTLRAQTLGRARAQDPTQTNVTFLPLYGSHTSAILVREKEGIDDNAAIVLRHIAYDFMTNHGAKFKGDDIPDVVVSKKNKGKFDYVYKSIEALEERPIDKSAREKKDSTVRQRAAASGENLSKDQLRNRRALESYALMRKNDKSYQYKMKPSSRRRSGVTRGSARLKDYEPHSEFFCNRHQSSLFAKEYAKAYRYLFEKNIPDPSIPKKASDTKVDELALLRSGKQKSSRVMLYREEEVKNELMLMSKINPQLFKSLDVLGVKLTHGIVELPPPSGIARIDRWDMTGKQSKPDLDILKDSIIQELRIYQAERSWWRDLFHIKNRYDAKAEEMCEKVHTIMSKPIDDKKRAAHLAREFERMKDIFKQDGLTGDKFYRAIQKCAAISNKTNHLLGSTKRQATRTAILISEEPESVMFRSPILKPRVEASKERQSHRSYASQASLIRKK